MGDGRLCLIDYQKRLSVNSWLQLETTPTAAVPLDPVAELKPTAVAQVAPAAPVVATAVMADSEVDG